MLYYYKIYGFVIESDYELEEAKNASGKEIENIDIVIKQGELDKRITEETEEEKGKTFGRTFCLRKERGWFRCFGQGSFLITNGSLVTYQLKDSCDGPTVNEIILCLILPVVLIQRSCIMIHGSGICWEGKTFILSGQSGAGKSTLTESILLQGAKFLADDTVALKRMDKQLYAEPAYPQQKLCESLITDEMKKNYNMVRLPDDAGIVKYGVRMTERFCDKAQPLSAIIEIQKDDQISSPELHQIHGSDKLKYLMNNLYKISAYKMVGVSSELMKELISIANDINIYVLKRPIVGMTTEKQVELLQKELFNKLDDKVRGCGV